MYCQERVNNMEKKIMTNEEMNTFIERVGRSEIWEEKRRIANGNLNYNYPTYLKAVRVTLITLGYDQDWVETVFAPALDAKYL